MGEFTKAKWMELPRIVNVGHGALNEVGAVCSNLKLRSPGIVVCDQVTKDIAGDTVVEEIRKAGFDVEIELIKDASEEVVEDMVGLQKERGAHFFVGVGGGRPIDVAKCASANTSIPFISVPTAASHDGIVSARASISKKGISTSISARPPLAVVGDTAIIAAAPYRLLASGCADIVSNYTAVLDWKLASRLRNEYYSSYAATLSELSAQILIENSQNIKPGLEESAWLVMKALVSSGVAMSIGGSSRPASGAEHMFSHALDRIAPGKAMHGEQCGVGSIMMMYLHGGDWKQIRDSLMNMGAPVNAKQLGISEEDVINALVAAKDIRPERYTILGDSGLSRDVAENVARITKVI